jgi:transposase-like protein
VSRENRKYDKEFKFNAVELYKNGGKSAAKVAADLGIPRGTLYQWVKEYEREGKQGFRGKGVIRSSNEEMYRLRKELEDTKLERDILKKAVAIFSKLKA